jgi:DNA-directed RNA polymerase subunit RPC12/RpoP
LAFYLYICQRCGHKITVNANETSLRILTEIKVPVIVVE